MDKQLQKLIELSNKTGDRLIVFDPNNEQSAYVVMGVNDYEKMAIGMSEVRGLTEDELLDKINRDIAIWKSDKIDDNIEQNFDRYSLKEQNFEDEFSVEDDWHSVEDIAQNIGYREDDEERFENKKNRAWNIPKDRKKRAEEIIEEDRYYLETLED